MKIALLTLASALLLLGVAAKAQQPTFANLDYVGNGNPKQSLDLYIPAGLTTAAPLIVYIHGGGWSGGAKGGAMAFCDTLFRNGYVVADINYRLSGDSIFPAQIYDCKAAVRWLKAHAQQYNIDTCRVAVTGSSAGGHLASLVGTSGGVDSLEDMKQGSTSASSTVHAVIPFYGPSDFSHMQSHIPLTPPDSCTNPLDHDAPGSPTAMLLGCTQMKDCPDRVTKASPITYIDSNDPPYYLLHGSFDCTVPPHQSVLMDSALALAGVSSTLLILPRLGHAFRPDVPRKRAMLTFLNTVLEPCTQTGVHGEFGRPPSMTIRQHPVGDFLTIYNPERLLAMFTIVNIMGVEVLRAELPAGDINVAELSSGLYFISIYVGSSVQIMKFVKY